MVAVSLDSPSCEVTLFDLVSVVYRVATRQAKGLHRLKHIGALERGLAYLSRCNSGWFCHIGYGDRCSYPRILRYPREYVVSITYVNVVCTTVIVRMLFL
jgi:hypothetical protein